MATYAIRRRGLQSEIQEIVKRYIIDHGFKPGDPLPGEGELAKQMGISRPSLREAMKVLQTIGVIETRHGAGTFVGHLSLDPIADGLAFQILLATNDDDSVPRELLDLIDIRVCVETHHIGQACGQHTAAQLERMRKLNDELVSSDVALSVAAERDLALHQMFYQPLDSRIATEFVKLFWRICTFSILPEAFQDEAVELNDHSAIIEALEANDRDAARAAITEHLTALSDAARAHHDPQQLRDRMLGTPSTR